MKDKEKEFKTSRRHQYHAQNREKMQAEFNEIDKKNDMLAIIMRGYEMEIVRQKKKLTE